MAALCQQQRVSIAQTYAQLVGGGSEGVESTPLVWQPSVRGTAQQPAVNHRRLPCATASVHQSNPALQRVGKPSGTVRPFEPAGIQAARQQRQASMATSIERARRVARAKWEAERPSILAELKQNRPPSSDQRHRRASSHKQGNTRPELLGGAWKTPPVAAAEERPDLTADEELVRLRLQMQQMKQYVSTMEVMIGRKLASEAVAGARISGTEGPPEQAVNPVSESQPSSIPLAPVLEESAAEIDSPVESSVSNVDLDSKLLFETFETARHACAEVIEAEAEHGNMLERVSTSPLANHKCQEESPAASGSQMPVARSPLSMLTVDPNNIHAQASPPVGRGSPAKALADRMGVSPDLPSTDSGSPTDVVAYTEYSECEEYAETCEGSPAGLGGVQVIAVVESEQPVVMRGRLSF